jgi:hypothetical protein
MFDRLTSDRHPQLEVLNWAQISPRRHFGHLQFSGEVYDRSGRLCELSLRPNGPYGYQHTPQSQDINWKSPRKTLNGKYLYIGIIFEMFGHDLIESTSRLWPLLEDSFSKEYDGAICHPWRTSSSPIQICLNEPTASIFSKFGINPRNLHVLQKEILEVEMLVVPEIVFKIANHSLDMFRNIFKRIAEDFSIDSDFYNNDRVYLSRSRIGNRVSPLENEFEAIANRQGYVSIHPQSTSFASQISLMRKAKRVAGFDGSAMHMTGFCDPRTRVVSLDTRHVQTQQVIEALFDLDGRHVIQREFEGDQQGLEASWRRQLADA